MKQLTELVVFMIAFSLVMPAHIVFARPQGGNVVAGNANIHHSGNNTTINQNSDRAIINWNSFDIGRNEAVRHNMPSASSAALHRVVGGGGPSQIQGLLQSNGNIYLVNPAGVVIHNGARINTNSFTATSRDISNSNFMKGNMVFDRPGRPDAQIINQGNITVKESGLAALVAPTVRNEGVIAGKLAKVALASGDSTWKLDMHGDELITFTVDEKDVDTLYSTEGKQLGVTNNGKIKAEGGIVVMTAAQLDGIVNSVVNTGEVSAASAEVAGGKITFRSAGDVTNTGVVDASSSKAKGGEIRMVAENKATSTGTIKATGKTTGGKAVVTGKEVALKGKAKVDVSGDTGGGTALIGGNALGKGPERNAKTTKVEKDVTLLADARKKGNGGEVVVWADEKTTFAGSISAKGGSEGGDGGKVETSGKSLKIEDGATVDTSAQYGIYGKWLLDPMDFIIAASDGDMSGATLSNSLASTNMEIKSEQGQTTGNGDIIVNDEIKWDTDTTLALNADCNVIIKNNITASGDNSSLIVNHNTGNFDILNAKITLSGINQILEINGNKYFIIHNLEELSSIANDCSGYYALADNIYLDSRVRGLRKDFDGIFNGLGNSIYGLYTDYGLFDSTSDNAIIENLHLKECGIIGGNFYSSCSFLVYTNNGIIRNCSVDGKISLEIRRSSDDYGYDIGGLVNTNWGDVINSKANVIIDIDRRVTDDNARIDIGGLIGTNFGNVYNSSSSPTINISSVSNVSTVVSTYMYIGGLIGSSSGSNIISNSYSHSNINIDRLHGKKIAIGGLIARASSEEQKIINCYSSCNINLDNVSDPYNRNIYAGFLAQNFDSIVTNCYWNKDESFGYTDEYALGLTTSEMKNKSSFNDWDFENIWYIDEGKSYPILQIENSTKIIPDTDLNTDSSTENNTNNKEFSNNYYFDAEAYQNSIFLPLTDEEKEQIERSKKLKEQRKKEQENKKQLNNTIIGFIHNDYFPAIISDNGSITQIQIMVDSYQEINNKYLVAESIKKGFVDISTGLITGNPLEFLESVLTDANYGLTLVQALGGKILLNKSKFYYEKFLELYNNPLSKNNSYMTETMLNNLMLSNQYAVLGMAVSQEIFNEMEEISQQSGLQRWASSVGEMSLGIVGNLTSSITNIVKKPESHGAIPALTSGNAKQYLDILEIFSSIGTVEDGINKVSGNVSFIQNAASLSGNIDVNNLQQEINAVNAPYNDLKNLII